MVKNRSMLWWTALLIGWSFDLLYWGKAPGISFALQISLTAALVWITARRENAAVDPKSIPLGILAVLFGILTFLRAEPFTRVLNHLAALGFLGLFILVYESGSWLRFRPLDFVMGGFRLLINTIALPLDLLSSKGKSESGETESEQDKKEQSSWRAGLAYLRGILIALPILAVLGALLSEADPIFSEWLREIIEALRLEKLPEYILRAFLISLWTLLGAGLLLFAVKKSGGTRDAGQDRKWPPRFLGFTETAIVLGSVDLMFAAFVTIQFRYFFGGEQNITAAGFTYAEYARRGFGELLAVAFITLGLMIILSAISRQENRKQRSLYSGLSILMTLLIGVILLSSHQRLVLYESAYGFTQLRTYSHICILWIGALFAAVLILELSGQQRFFTLAGILAVVGFTLTLNGLNVDRWIVEQNLARAASGEQELDTNYFTRLSDDAVPTLIAGVQEGNLEPDELEELSAALACRARRLKDTAPDTWQSFLLPTWRAEQLLQENKKLWKDVILVYDYGSFTARLSDGDFYCRYYTWD